MSGDGLPHGGVGVVFELPAAGSGDPTQFWPATFHHDGAWSKVASPPSDTTQWVPAH